MMKLKALSLIFILLVVTVVVGCGEPPAPAVGTAPPSDDATLKKQKIGAPKGAAPSNPDTM